MTAPLDLADLEAFFADPEFAVPSISPDGTRIAYLAPAHGRRNIRIRGIDQTHDDAVPVTHDIRRSITTIAGSRSATCCGPRTLGGDATMWAPRPLGVADELGSVTGGPTW